MKIQLLQGDFNFLFEVALIHDNGDRVRQPVDSDEGLGDEDVDTVLIQTDWDQPALARNFGWDMRTVQKCKPRPSMDWTAECGIWVCEECREPWYPMELEYDDDEQECCPDCGEHCIKLKICEHHGTDGTVKCKECGCEPTDFITAAGDWLLDNIGATAEDPGYFGG